MSDVTWQALTPANWTDLEVVMGDRGGARGCWCMHWRLSFASWQQGQGEGNRSALRERAEQDPPPGVVCYRGQDPVGWVAIADRSEYPRMQRSWVTKPIDDTPVWVISCVLVRTGHRAQGLHPALINAACEFAAHWNQHTVEAIPIEPDEQHRAGPDSAMTGIASSYTAAGFTELARRKPDRPVMRRVLDESTPGTN